MLLSWRSSPFLPCPHWFLLAHAAVTGVGGRGEPNDGVLMLSETRLQSIETIQLHATHTFIMNHPSVAQRILADTVNSSKTQA